jgi:nicotinamide riboside kinase
MGRYTQPDLIHIGKQQLLSEQKAASLLQRPIFCDTDILVVLIWQKFKFGKPEPELHRLFENQVARKYLLTYPDLPWLADPLRENEHQLAELFDLYEEQLKSLNLEYRVIRGTGQERFKNALSAVDQLKLG